MSIEDQTFGSAEELYNAAIEFYESGRYSKAVEYFNMAAEQGNAPAQCRLGSCYEIGIGVEIDLSKAIYWYEKSAERGYSEAQYNLGLCYKNGTGVSQDEYLAYCYFKLASEQGDNQAAKALKEYDSSSDSLRYERYYKRFLRQRKNGLFSAARKFRSRPFAGIGIVFIVIHGILLLILLMSLFSTKGCFTYLFSMSRSTQSNPFAVGLITLFVAAHLGAGACLLLLLKVPSDKRTLQGCLIVVPLITTLLLAISVIGGLGSDKEITTIFMIGEDEVEVTYKADDGLNFNDFPEFPDREGCIFAGWVNQYGDTIMDISKGDFTSYTLTPTYVSSTKVLSLKATSIEEDTDCKTSFSFNELKRLMSRGYTAYFDYTYEIPEGTSLTLSASGGHTKKYTASVNASLKLNFAREERNLFNLDAELDANWFSRGETVTPLDSLSISETDIKVEYIDDLSISQSFVFESMLGDKGSANLYMPESKLTLDFRTVKL